jgi:hypothetical protein
MGNLRQSMTTEEWDEMGHSATNAEKKNNNSSSVNHPHHYGGKDNVYEAIKVIDAWGLDFVLGNAVKYISRAGKKTDDPLEDLEKAKWYICHAIERCKQKN